MPKCDFNKVAKHGCSPVKFLYIFSTPFPRNTSGWLLLTISIHLGEDKSKYSLFFSLLNVRSKRFRI